MTIQNNLSVRYPTEAKLLNHALNGDVKALKCILYYLSSSNPILCQIMQKAVHDLKDPRIWNQLLRYLALRQWNEQITHDECFGLDALERIDQAIIEVFTQDERGWEKCEKESALMVGLNESDLLMQQACAYLLALRGDVQAIPFLADTVKNGTRNWQLRAIKALEFLNRERCAQPLLTALFMNRDELHREACRALHNLGQLARPAWVNALNHPDKHIRWEAAHGLGQIGDARAVDILAEGLLDENYAIRWATVDVLVHLGARTIPSVLTILSRCTLNELSRQAAYHALHGILSASTHERIKPLLDALKGPVPDIEARTIAQRLLLEWKKSEGTTRK
jgi:HEAT repeat protein